MRNTNTIRYGEGALPCAPTTEIRSHSFSDTPLHPLPKRPHHRLHDAAFPGYPDSSFVAAMASVSERANSGDRVFHSDWDEFPVLWNIDDRLKYVAGLDPTFLYQASSTLSDAYRDLTWGATTPTKEQAWEFINDKIGARFVFIAKSDHEQLLDFIKSDERYKPLIETEDAAMFEVW